MKQSLDETDYRVSRILAWAVLLEVIEKSGGDDVSVPIHTLGAIGRSISEDMLYLAKRIEEMKTLHG